MDEYQHWLIERIQEYTHRCLEDAERIGYPGKIKFADQVLREILDTYEEVLEKYNECKSKQCSD